MNFIRVLIKMSSYESPNKSQLTISRRGKKFRHVATGMVSGLSVGFLRGYARRCNARCWPKARSQCNEARYIRPQLSLHPLLPSAAATFLFLSPSPFSFSSSREVVSYQRRMAGGEARPETRRGSREDARERERVELEARSVIRQVGIHIYRVVKSIGVSVSRVSCKEGVVGMRCELIERERRGRRRREDE